MSPFIPALALSATAAVWPLLPVPDVIHPFDPPSQDWYAGHRGVDLGGTTGEEVRAALDGVVSFAGRIAGKGVVVIAHSDGRRTTYEPVAPSVHTGDHISAGDVIGTLELEQGHCVPAACLHWGLLDGDDEYEDPLSLMKSEPGPVRLLPVDD